MNYQPHRARSSDCGRRADPERDARDAEDGTREPREGATTTEILADFPTLSEEDVRRPIAFAAGSAQEICL